ncbi:MAG: alpha/beta hydrolase, partial [Clostridia bacterium]|nr:alpha/beta hydrolase [Clostridia bacterium]
MYFLIVLAILMLLFICVVLYFFSVAFVRLNPKKVKTIDTTIDDALKPYSALLKKGEDFIKNTPHKWCYTKSFDGIKLAGRYYDNNSSCTVFLFHGYRSNATHDFSCAVQMYYDMGFNVFMPDQRAHGKSEGKLITFGVKESRDVVTWTEYINRKYATKQLIITGISMGATTVLLSLKHNLPKNVMGVIADCGFTSPEEIIVKVGKDAYKVNPTFFIPFLDCACKLIGGFSIRNQSTIDAVKNTELPIFFIHGKKDNFVPCEMSEKTFSCCKENCRIFISAEAGHGLSFLTDTDTVLSEIKSFLTYCIK